MPVVIKIPFLIFEKPETMKFTECLYIGTQWDIPFNYQPQTWLIKHFNLLWILSAGMKSAPKIEFQKTTLTTSSKFSSLMWDYSTASNHKLVYKNSVISDWIRYSFECICMIDVPRTFLQAKAKHVLSTEFLFIKRKRWGETRSWNAIANFKGSIFHCSNYSYFGW